VAVGPCSEEPAGCLPPGLRVPAEGPRVASPTLHRYPGCDLHCAGCSTSQTAAVLFLLYETHQA